VVEASWRVDLIDRRFGRLTAKYYLGSAADRSGSIWRCRCECGVWVRVRRKQLTTGSTKSCGCLRLEYNRWQGAEGFDKVVKDLTGGISEVTSDDYEPALRLTRVLVNKFGIAVVAKALRELRTNGRSQDYKTRSG